MEEHLIQSCSKTVQDAIDYIYQETEQQTDYDLSFSPAFLALSKVNSDKPIEYIWNENIEENIDDYIYENIDFIVHFSKLYQVYEGSTWEQHDQLCYARNKLIGLQMSKGEFAISDYPLGGPIWFLSQEDETSRSVQKALDQLVKEDWYVGNYLVSLVDIAINILDLVEVGKKEHEKTLEMSDRLASEIVQIIDEKEYPFHEYVYYYSYIPMALSQVKKDYEVVNELIEGIKGSQSSNGSFADHLGEHGLAVLALIACGEGPKIPVTEMENRLREKDEKIEQSKAHFVSTIPSTRQETREISIQENIKDMIRGSEEEIRISTLRIDMIHEGLIDKIDTSEISIKILTGESSASGDRSKLKNAAMNDLVKRTDGNVREDRLVHSRMVIADAESLLVSSADLTREQLVEEFNTGIYTKDDVSIEAAIESFETMWTEAEPRGVR